MRPSPAGAALAQRLCTGRCGGHHAGSARVDHCFRVDRGACVVARQVTVGRRASAVGVAVDPDLARSTQTGTRPPMLQGWGINPFWSETRHTKGQHRRATNRQAPTHPRRNDSHRHRSPQPRRRRGRARPHHRHHPHVPCGGRPVLVHNCGGTVWDDIKGAQPEIPGTGGLPKSFELTAGDTKVWVHGS